jgi:hypothetical protein
MMGVQLRDIDRIGILDDRFVIRCCGRRIHNLPSSVPLTHQQQGTVRFQLVVMGH